MSRPSSTLLAGLPLAIAFIAAESQAVVLRVGSNVGCTHATVQAAVDALPAAGAHEIRIGTGNYTAQAIKIGARTVTLRGGYASCQASSPTGSTTLSGQGGAADSVVTITGNANAVVLDNLSIIRGDETLGSIPDFDNYGGGVDFRGNGVVTLRATSVSQNVADYGAGISVTGIDGEAELRLESDTVIQLNEARISGGGIRLDGRARLLALQDRIGIYSNTAVEGSGETGGYGGGVLVIGPATADIGSPGFGNNGVIAFNTARYGGGIALVSGADDVDVRARLFTTDPQRAVRLHGNRATQTGGAIYIAPFWDGYTAQPGLASLYAYDYRIEDNQAQNGSAIYADEDDNGAPYYEQIGSDAYLQPTFGDVFPTELGAVHCAAGVPCRLIAGNATETSAGAATDGATLVVQTDGSLFVSDTTFRDNRGGRLLHAFGSDVGFSNSLIVDNTLSLDLISHPEGPGSFDQDGVTLSGTTVAGNDLAAGHVISTVNDLSLHRSILWQPGKTLVQDLGGANDFSQLLVSEVASLGGPNAAFVVFDPRFVDPANGDYRLRAGSPGVDFAPPPGGAGPSTDLEGAARITDIGAIPDFGGIVDVGAYERPTLQPLAINGDFDLDVRLWQDLRPNSSARDAAQNVVGSAGSGALRIDIDNPTLATFAVRQQCVHLPVPGRYALNASGRAGGTISQPSTVLLGWELRHDGGATCTGGPADGSGEHALATLFAGPGGSGWKRPAIPAEIEIPPESWTIGSSINIILAVRANVVPTSEAAGWIDRVFLDLVGSAQSGLPFADGFED